MRKRYEILEKIGKGGVSEILRAYDTELHREVAIKRLLPLEKTRLNEADAYGLEREVQALTRLRHPNVVSLFEFGEDREGPFVVLELIEGETLQKIVYEEALSYSDFLDVTRQILAAIIAADELSLVHRDIKPGNIMLTPLPSGELQVKVLDFGVSKFQQFPTAQTVDVRGAVIGSADYIAPEQVERCPIDHRADLYSIGCVLYFALTQRKPFHGDNIRETVQNHLNHNVVPIRSIRSDLPVIVGAWLMKLLERDPDDRPMNGRVALAMFDKACRLAHIPDADDKEIRLREDPTASIELGGHHLPPQKSSDSPRRGILIERKRKKSTKV
jgi:serine/threonine protein kinase